MKRTGTLLVAILLTASALAQIPGLGGKKIPGIPGIGDLFKKGPAITTSLPDAKWEVTDKDNFNPETKPLSQLERGTNNGFVLKAGGFSATVQSYCLKAGTHGPGGGEAYLFAPPKGPYEKAVITIVQNSVKKDGIPQQKIQLLLWAMIARTKFTDLGRDLQATAAELLTAKQIADLNGGALGFLTDEAMKQGLVKEPPLLRQIYEAENNLRKALTSPASTFEDMERIAVLTGVVEKGPGSRDVPKGRWSLHPDGYYVRYLPSGYSRTQLEIFVPEGAKCIGKEFDPATHIAVPCDTARQRLIQSGRIVKE